ncbi:MAG TPA: ATP-binding protein [Rhizomicrobium sp.]|jgi:C4-dicarboxylate-specific signal transduction histidine kinase|nr:ATP-binding protein [Rhizomicrobium sp.]
MSGAGDDLDHWADARSSMQQFERAATRVSLPWFGGASLLAVAVVLFITLGVLLDLSRTRLSDSFAWTRHGDAILLRLVDIRQSVAQAEANARAFALIPDPANVAALTAAQREWRTDEAALRALVSDNPAQQQRLDQIYGLVEARFARLEWFVRLDAAARAAIVAMPADRPSRTQQRRLSAQITTRLAAFRAVEIGLLDERRAFAERDSTILDYLSIALALLAPLCGVAGFYLLFQERHRRHARELQMELIHTQRLALMGETASMLAHEVNQPLAAATNYLSVVNRLAAGTGGTEKLRETAQKAAEQINRAVSIVQRLRNFIAKRDSERASESAALVVAEAVSLFGTLRTTIRLRTDIAPGLPNLYIDRVQIEQVLVNLLRNALEAMQASERRELDLSVSAVAGGMVQFALRDTGPGLPREVAERLFRPFVSTKPDGMGVGLSICRKIVSDHGGRIWAMPAEGGGTVFAFTLPGHDGDTAAEAA